MRTPERIQADRLRPGGRTQTGEVLQSRGPTATPVHDQVLDCSTTVPTTRVLFRFGQSGTTRGIGHGVFA